MATQIERLRAARAKKEEVEAVVAASAKDIVTRQQAAPIPPAAQTMLPGAPQVPQKTIPIRVVGVLKQRDEKGEERGVEQTLPVTVPNDPGIKVDMDKVISQVFMFVRLQQGGLLNRSEDGSYILYKDDLFERYGATIMAPVGVTLR